MVTWLVSLHIAPEVTVVQAAIAMIVLAHESMHGETKNRRTIVANLGTFRDSPPDICYSTSRPVLELDLLF